MKSIQEKLCLKIVKALNKKYLGKVVEIKNLPILEYEPDRKEQETGVVTSVYSAGDSKDSISLMMRLHVKDQVPYKRYCFHIRLYEIAEKDIRIVSHNWLSLKKNFDVEMVKNIETLIKEEKKKLSL